MFVSYGLLLSDPSVVASSVRYSCALNIVHWASERNIEYVCFIFCLFVRFVNFIFIILCTKCKIIFLRHSSSCEWSGCVCVCVCRVYSLCISKFSAVHNFSFSLIRSLNDEKICNFLQKKINQFLNRSVAWRAVTLNHDTIKHDYMRQVFIIFFLLGGGSFVVLLQTLRNK